MSDTSDGDFRIWFPAGVGLAGIGLLTLLTPLLTELSPHDLAIDVVAGVTLLLVGGWCIYKGKRPA